MAYVRTQVQLRPEQHKSLKEEAFRRGVSLSSIMREALDERFGATSKPLRDSEAIQAFVGCGRGGASDIARDHDDYLTGRKS